MKRHTRKVKPKKNAAYCRGPHKGPWTHVKTDLGMNHTCACGYNYTEVHHNVTVTQYVKGKAVGGNGMARLEV
jgi:hypothetical protein